MSCNEFSKSDPEWFRAIESMVCDTVLFFRNRGHKRDIAIEQAALALGLSNRKARSIFYQEPVGTLREEYEAIRERFARHLEYQAEDYARRSEGVRAKLRQMDLGV